MDYTQNYNLNLPEHGYRNWDTPNNENFETIDSVLNGLETSKVNLNLGNSTAISNCITEIPQDIKLELNNGTITLKAGSKVYVPNGFEEDGTTLKFDEVIISEDMTWGTSITSGTRFGMFTGTSFTGVLSRYLYSGNTSTMNSTTANTYARFYNTETNKIYVGDSNGGNWIEANNSLSVCIFENDSSGLVTSIDQVFNGFGDIGSTIFALPGVKGLFPNGRNEDGSLKTIEFELDSVKIMTNLGSSDFRNCVIYRDLSIGHPMGVTYDSVNNMTYESEHDISGFCIFGGAIFSSGMVTSFTPKTVLHAVDYNDLSEVYCVVETYVNGSSWYRIWSDEWIEQGGFATRSAATQTVTFLKAFVDTNYNIQISPRHTADSTDGRPPLIRERTNTGFTLNLYTSYEGCYWQACGYGA